MPEEHAERSVAHYLLLDRIGVGGLGEVFRARDTQEGRTIALKLVPQEVSDDPERRERFLQDARAAAALSHPAIALLFEAGEFENRLFLAFEFVPGETLRRALAGGPMHPKRAVPIAIQIADALAEGHAAGIVHRDITPDNIMVTPKGAAKVLDFGLSSWTKGGAARQAALTDAAIDPAVVTGTVAYMSPEQALGQPADHRTDLFSLGVVIYEMLTGRNPFVGPTATDTVVGILKVRPEPPSNVNAEVPPALDDVVLRLLAHDLGSRYADAATVAADLRASYAERTETVFEEDVPAAAPAASRRTLPWLLLAVLVVIVAAAALAYPRRDAIRGWWRYTFGSPPAPVVAVMPFQEAGQRDTDFADGLTEDVMMRLAQTPGVRLPGRSASRASRGRPPAEVAKRTGASVVLAGTIDRAEGDVRLDLELIDPADGLRIWRRSFINPMGNIFVAQALIATAVADALKLEAPPSELNARTMARTVAPEAYEAYARGRAALARRDLDAAVSLFEKATALDTGLAEAHAGLAEALYLQAVQTGRAWDDDTRARVRQAAARAAAIEPELASVEMAAGLAADSYRETLRHLVRAATLDPSSATAYHEIGAQLLQVDTERAVRLYERSRALDAQLPANYPYLFAAEIVLGHAERAARVIDEMERALPLHPRAGLMRARLAARGEDTAAGVAALKAAASRDDLTDAEYVGLAQFLAQAGRRPEALETLEAVLQRRPASCELVALKAALFREGGRGTEARTLATPLLASRRPPCAALAAAAMADAAAAAAALRAIAADERSLRPWLQSPFAPHGELALRERLYPWGNVLDAPEVG
ncbi:MAG TPA: protein kinase, partial [Vicinamibacterales bacterium]|nr:protein kinase [Vicinamibacterales bacterium]